MENQFNHEVFKKIIINQKETNYSISNLGRLRNDKKYSFLLKRAVGESIFKIPQPLLEALQSCFLKPLYNKRTGYSHYQFNAFKKLKHCYIHRLVAEYFHPDFSSDLEVDHIDGNRTNNQINNLRCVRLLRNRDKVKNWNPRLLDKYYSYEVIQYSGFGTPLQTFKSIDDACIQLDLTRQNVIQKCKYYYNDVIIKHDDTWVVWDLQEFKLKFSGPYRSLVDHVGWKPQKSKRDLHEVKILRFGKRVY